MVEFNALSFIIDVKKNWDTISLAVKCCGRMLLPYCNTVWYHNPEDLDTNHHCCGNLKSHMMKCYLTYMIGQNLYHLS